MNLTTVFRRSVSTLSPLASAFNRLSIHRNELFPNLFQNTTGLFGQDMLRNPSGFYLMKENAIIECDKLIREAFDENRKRKMVQIFDNLSNCLCKVADLAEFVRVGHPSKNFANCAEQASMAISAEVEKLNTNKPLYDVLKNVVENGDIVPLDPIDEHVAKLFLYDFEQSGIHLDEEKRKLVVQLNEFILHVGSYFMNSTHQPRTIEKSKLPGDIIHCFKPDGNHLVVNGLYNDHDNESVREAAYKIFLYPDNHQENLLIELIEARLKLAKTCGFESYAHRAVKRSIADTPEAVMEFLDCLNENLLPLSNSDFQQMLNLKIQENRHAKSLKAWDIVYYTSVFKHNKYSQDITSCAPYFSLGSCIEGLNLIFNCLFGVHFDVCQTKSGELWHHDVVKLGVIDNQTNETLGCIYCDFFERPIKPHHDCHFTIQGGCQLDGKYQKPIVVLMLNLPKPTIDSPSLLSPHLVDNLFHEMGHAMHSMLARTPYQHITGTRCSTDLAEVPSILMEFFASDSRIVKSFAKHFQTGQQIPNNLLESWIQSKSVFLASDMQLQVFYSALDQAFHSSDPLKGNRKTTEILAQIQKKYHNLEHVPDTAWQLRFGHLVGYGAKYYSYLTSKSVAYAIWNKLFINDPLNSKAGQKFKQDVLSHGGGKPPKDIVNSVLETQVSPKFLANSLLDYLKNYYKKIN